MLPKLQKLFFSVSMIFFAGNALALPINNHQELWVLGKIQNQGYVNWGYQLQFKAYNSSVLPTGLIAYNQTNGDFRISTFANTQQTFDLDYITTITVDHADGFQNYDQPLCRFTLQVNPQGLTQLSVKTLENSYVQCGVNQDTAGIWIITLTNPAEIS